jgi:hypothetical protein
MQADIYLSQDGFLERAELCLEQNVDLLGVSGRGIVDDSRHYTKNMFDILSSISRLSPAIFFSRSQNLIQKKLGWYLPRQSFFGSTAVRPLSEMKFSSKDLYSVFLGPTVIRGPIVWRASDFFELGGLKDHCFFLGRDEQDLCFRGFRQIRKFVGYLPTAAHSYLWQGTSHKPRTTLAEKMFQERKNLAEHMECGASKAYQVSLPKMKIRRIQAP